MAHVKNIHTVLIANRGEIALRIQRTAHEMGFSTVAVYSEGDANDVFVRNADMAIALKGKTSAETYLDIQQILGACKLSGANAVHPGYGFLSENAEFAQAVMDAGLIWVGPSPDAIAKMGDKLSAKSIMETAGVPVLNGFEITGNEDCSKQASDLGYPLLIKASAGGGGKGMRVVEEPAGLTDAVASAQREAKAAFGDETVFVERWLTSTRHVEVQILGDENGNLVHCFERECSIQRRHQKVIEEAPSPAVTENIRQRMGEAAVNAAKQLGYYSTGTVEFLLSGEEFFFLEINTRLQVEHPVTEAITGLDLVREQFRVAQGEPLEFEQDDLSINGHAIEARLYAEDPSNDFLPSPGDIAVWKPCELGGVRFDSAVESGSSISMEFDPMIAKVIAYGATRKEAAAKLSRALASTQLQGITSNKDFLVETLRHSAFLSGDTTTDFIERINPKRKAQIQDEFVNHALVSVLVVKREIQQAASNVLNTIPRGWLNSKLPLDLKRFEYEGQEKLAACDVKRNGDLFVHIADSDYQVQVHELSELHVDLSINGLRMTYEIANKQDHWFVYGNMYSLDFREVPRFESKKAEAKEGELASPMPSVVQKILVQAGDIVEEGQTLLLLESMKMELRINAPRNGIVADIPVKKGSNVETGEILVSLESLSERLPESQSANESSIQSDQKSSVASASKEKQDQKPKAKKVTS